MVFIAKQSSFDPEGLSLTDEETQVGDDFDGMGLEGPVADRRVQFSFVRTYELVEDTANFFDRSSESSEFEPRSDAQFTVDDYELGRGERARLRRSIARPRPQGRTNERANQWLEHQRAEALVCEERFERRKIISQLEENRTDCILQERTDCMFQGSSCLPDIDASESSNASYGPDDVWLVEHRNEVLDAGELQDAFQPLRSCPLFQATNCLPDIDASESSMMSCGPSASLHGTDDIMVENRRDAFQQFRSERLSSAEGAQLDASESSTFENSCSETRLSTNPIDKRDAFQQLRHEHTDGVLADTDTSHASSNINMGPSEQFRSSSLPDLDASESSLMSSGLPEEWLEQQNGNNCFKQYPLSTARSSIFSSKRRGTPSHNRPSGSLDSLPRERMW